MTDAGCENKLFNEFIEKGVYIVPGAGMFCDEPGWFRITITQRPEILAEGIKL